MTDYVNSVAWDNNDTINLAAAYYGTRWYIGASIQAGSAWIGLNVTQFDCKIGITGSPTGTIDCQLFANASGTPGTPITSTNSLELNTLSDGDTISFTFDEGTTAVYGILAVHLTEAGTDVSNYINLKGKLTPATLIKQALYPGPGWEAGNETPNCRMGYTATPTSTGTRLPPPPIVLGGL